VKKNEKTGVKTSEDLFFFFLEKRLFSMGKRMKTFFWRSDFTLHNASEKVLFCPFFFVIEPILPICDL